MSNGGEPASLILVTGPSGAGRSTAIAVFEDLGFEAIDNMPMALLPRLVKGPAPSRPMAIGITPQTRGFSVKALFDLIDFAEQSEEYEVSLVYLDCDTSTLLRRYSETRRRHPMAPDGTPLSGIQSERDLLGTVRSRAHVLIDTTNLTPHELKSDLSEMFSTRKTAALAITLHSFSYKRGVPRGVDMVIDCRFLANPHWQPDLRPHTGKDADVQDFVTKDPRFEPFFKQLLDMLQLLLPAYKDEGKAHFGIGLGCTGGRHRSVTLTEKLSNALENQGWQVSIRHRELNRHDP